jgi:hypothetical protein
MQSALLSCLPSAASHAAACACGAALQVAAGTAASSITLYDTASGRLLAVQRLLAGPGPVSCLAAWLDTQLLSAAALAPPGPRVPDGGGVLSGPNVGAPWRGVGQAGGQQEDGASGECCGRHVRILLPGLLHGVCLQELVLKIAGW